MKIYNLGMKSICPPLPWVQSFRTGKKGLRSVMTKKHDKECEQQNHNIPGAGKFRPEGSLGTIAAGWFCTRAKKASEGSEKTISSYVSATTGFLIDWGPLSSSGNNFSCPDANRNTRDRTGLSRRKKLRERERERERQLRWEKQREGVRNCGCQPLGLSSVKARRRKIRMEREGGCQEGLGKTMDEKEKEGERQREGRRGGRGEKHEEGGGCRGCSVGGAMAEEEGERYREGRGNKHGGGEGKRRQGRSTGRTTRRRGRKRGVRHNAGREREEEEVPPLMEGCFVHGCWNGRSGGNHR
ncbi:hypothetical protein C4D60_Mb05t23400 [Musa balbisiana]|uniref:Uncharacterized protein n=1 Tax=Musa balbisiana TaxID=52838 RepID=A0A4S8JY99_MUSBA|nr:hypothetical protein C4D60_Mb05t23400 [Musa balbisiana]